MIANCRFNSRDIIRVSFNSGELSLVSGGRFPGFEDDIGVMFPTSWSNSDLMRGCDEANYSGTRLLLANMERCCCSSFDHFLGDEGCKQVPFSFFSERFLVSVTNIVISTALSFRWFSFDFWSVAEEGKAKRGHKTTLSLPARMDEL